MAAIENDFYIGSINSPLYHFSNRSIVLNSITGVFTCDPLSNELPIDTFSFTVRFRYDANLVYAPVGDSGYMDTNDELYRLESSGVAQYADFVPLGSDKLIDSNTRTFRVFNGYAAGDYLDLPYGTPVWWYLGGAFYRKGYIKSIDRVSRYCWKITAISGVGLLDSKDHVGGLYTGQTFSAIARDIIGGAFGVYFSPTLASIPMYGHLPYAKARKNLHELCFAIGAVLKRRNASTDYLCTFLDQTEISVPPSRVAIGGSVNRELPSNVVEVTEHGFYQADTDQTVVLFNNTTGVAASRMTVVFKDAPVYDLQTSGSLVIDESSVNHAVVSGIGILTGKPYTHTRQLVRLSNRRSGEPERLRTVSNCELISLVNSSNTARRVLGYYSAAKTVQAKMHLEGEDVGATISTNDPFGELITSIIKKADVLATTVLGATVELVDGYVPGNEGNTYNNRQFFNASGSFVVPADVKTVKLVLIGGGSGGQGGYNGRRGYGVSGDIQRFTSSNVRGYEYKAAQTPAAGGSGGAAGSPGKVYVIELAVVPGSSIAVAPGAGGAGGAANGGAGSVGTASTVTIPNVGEISSDSGLVTNGYFDVIGQLTFAYPGENGLPGGDGGMADNGGNGHNGKAGQSGLSVSEYTGGTGGAGAVASSDNNYKASGGGGGGAAVGASGSNGTAGQATITGVVGGNGGAGASASAPTQPTYGVGGAGGNGGGGGGNAGLVQWTFNIIYPDPSYTLGTPGAGGSGSVGSKGGDGCVIIYY